MAVREGLSSSSPVSFFAADHLGSVTTTLWANGTVRAETRYYPWGQDDRWKVNVTPAGARFTNQRLDDTLNLYNYNARYYDYWIGRFITADTIVPSPERPQSFNRYSYVENRPPSRVDPSGRQDIPPELPTLVAQAIQYFTGLGWNIVGNPALINPSWNGADLVFTAENGARVLAVELKDVARGVDLGTLGWSTKFGDRGGSIARVARSAERFLNSSKDQLRLMSQTVLQAYRSGTLENALFTSGPRISQNAQNVFNGAYRVGSNGEIISEKAINQVSQPSFWAKVGTVLTAAKNIGASAVQAVGTAGEALFTALSTSPLLTPIYLPPTIRDRILTSPRNT